MSRKHPLFSIWPLLFGMAILAVAGGAQNTLLGIRSSVEGFSTFFIGIIMGAYYAGYMVGSIGTPKMIQNVGHVRSFAALTAIASVTILFHSVSSEESLWFFMRLINGFALSGIFVVTESWLNAASSDSNRGQVLAIYMTIINGGVILGQFLLNVADPDSFELFLLVSILVSIASIPILLSTTPTPAADTAQPIKLRKLLSWAPLGVTGIFMINGMVSTLFALGPIYAQLNHYSVAEIANYMAVLIAGGVVMNWPLGKLSDHYDRRKVIAVVLAVGVVLAIVCALVGARHPLWLILNFALGAFTFPLFSMFLALLNDYMKPEKVVAAAGSAILIGGAGSTIMPIAVSWGMERWGGQVFYLGIALVMGLTLLYAMYRIVTYSYKPMKETHEFSIYAPTLTPNPVLAQSEDPFEQWKSEFSPKKHPSDKR